MSDKIFNELVISNEFLKFAVLQTVYFHRYILEFQ